MTSRRQPLVVMGLGNILWGDDGLGVAAVAMLARRFDPPDGARVLDGGTLGLSLLPIIQDAERVLLLDAIRVGGADPGALVRIEGDEVAPAVRERLSPHQVGVADLLEAALTAGVGRVILISFPHVEGPTTPQHPGNGRLDGVPISVHARTRLEEERLLLEKTRGTTTTPVILRSATV